MPDRNSSTIFRRLFRWLRTGGVSSLYPENEGRCCLGQSDYDCAMTPSRHCQGWVFPQGEPE